jgi:hypothetical protein
VCRPQKNGVVSRAWHKITAIGDIDDFPTPEDGCHGSGEAALPYHHQICADCGGKMRYEVRQQDGKWLVWDTVNDCAKKAVVGGLTRIASNSARYTLNRGLLVLMPNSVTIEARPAMFWTQEEAQEWADTWNDIDQSDFV